MIKMLTFKSHLGSGCRFVAVKPKHWEARHNSCRTHSHAAPTSSAFGLINEQKGKEHFPDSLAIHFVINWGRIKLILYIKVIGFEKKKIR